ncbi:MAG TPA: hypothetical protein PKJ63_01930 [Cyclobacteriaceae bacterium]|nr:hypothetical protein [Cyclobacteriaceae bacterium]
MTRTVQMVSRGLQLRSLMGAFHPQGTVFAFSKSIQVNGIFQSAISDHDERSSKRLVFLVVIKFRLTDNDTILFKHATYIMSRPAGRQDC